MINASLSPLQPAADAVLSWMWWHGEDGQEARTLQKLPETSFRPVAQEQVGGLFLFYFFWLLLKVHIRFPTSRSLLQNSWMTLDTVLLSIFLSTWCLTVLWCCLWQYLLLTRLCFVPLQTLLRRPNQLVPGDQSHKSHVQGIFSAGESSQMVKYTCNTSMHIH